MQDIQRQDTKQPLGAVLGEVAKNFWYWALGFTVFITTILLAIWLPNLSFLKHTAVSSDYTITQKLTLFFASFGALDTNFTAFSRTTTIIIAVMFAVNIVLVVAYFRRIAKLHQAAGLGIIGIFMGLTGIGCVACGSVLLSSIFGVVATAGFIGILPLGGQEFSIASIIILGFSIFLTVKKLREPVLCKI